MLKQNALLYFLSFRFGCLEFGILRTGIPVVQWALFNVETVGAQSQNNVRERTLRIKY